VKLGLVTIAGIDTPLGQVLDAAAEHGLDGIELTARPPHVGPEDDLAAIGRTTRTLGLEIFALGSYLGREPQTTLAHAEAVLLDANALRAPVVRVWAEPFAERAKVVRLLRMTADRADALGMRLVIERHAGSLADTPERCEALLAEIDHPSCALAYQPLDGLRASEAAAQPDDARRLAPLSRHFHVKNYRDVDGTLELSAPLADGALDYGPILAAAVEAGYEGPLLLEFVSDDASISFRERVAADAAALRALVDGLG